MKVLDSYWFTPANSPLIGVVKVRNEMDEIKYYIGTSIGENMEDDEKYIAENGSKFPVEAAEFFFPDYTKLSEKNENEPDIQSWSYRIGTHIYSYKKLFPNNPVFKDKENIRLYSVIAVYYDTQGNPVSYSKSKDTVSDWESYDDLKDTVPLLQVAFDKPTFDLDNWPEIWDPDLDK